MLDYKLIQAFATVIEEGGFDKASKKLNLTQSAVSQRIKLLEENTGQVLIVRSTPPSPTFYGKKILNHFQKVRQLEHELDQDIFNNTKVKKLVMGINADSLATWFMPKLYSFLNTHNYLIDIRVDDQDETHKMLKNGEVFACISSKKINIWGCSSNFIGNMVYRPLASEDFKEKFFKSGFTKENIKNAPCVLFNRKDMLQDIFLKKIFQCEVKNYPAHYIPSSEKFLDFVLNGFAYGMIPDIQSKKYLEDKKLTMLSKTYIEVPLYLSSWNIESSHMESLTQIIASGLI